MDSKCIFGLDPIRNWIPLKAVESVSCKWKRRRQPHTIQHLPAGVAGMKNGKFGEFSNLPSFSFRPSFQQKRRCLLHGGFDGGREWRVGLRNICDSQDPNDEDKLINEVKSACWRDFHFHPQKRLIILASNSVCFSISFTCNYVSFHNMKDFVTECERKERKKSTKTKGILIYQVLRKRFQIANKCSPFSNTKIIYINFSCYRSLATTLITYPYLDENSSIPDSASQKSTIQICIHSQYKKVVKNWVDVCEMRIHPSW